MEQKIVGFLSNQLTLRGTEIAMYDYADFNETLLNNKSIIITRNYELVKHSRDACIDAYLKFQERFQVEYYISQQDIDAIVDKYKITHLYIIKGGVYDGLLSSKCINLIHCVFNTSQPHGQIYSTISSDVNRLFNTSYPVVPHMIRNFDTDLDLRDDLGIPHDAIVFGRYGGLETFDIEFVHQAIKKVLETRSDIYFIFMNTYNFATHPQIIYLNGTTSMEYKRKFINTTDAMIHAREQGETFGITCGEFAIQLKPVITWDCSRERNHINILGPKAVLYSDYNSVYKILNEFTKNKYSMESNGYFYYNPKNVMNIFNQVYFNKYDYYVFINGFWNGFIEKTDANHIEFFENILKKTKLSNYKITNDITQANVLLESCFGNSVLDIKSWKYSIFYSGEPFASNVQEYRFNKHQIDYTKESYKSSNIKHNIILFSEKSNYNIVNLPLFVYYIYGNNFIDKLISRSLITKVPKHFCCWIVSNGQCEIRNKMFNLLNTYKKVHSYGKYANNMGINLSFDYWTDNFRRFISNYKFIICFENSKFGTYSTEKIVNPYLSGTIPIYWSSHEIKNVFNENSMLFLEDETDTSFQNILEKVKELDSSDEKYLEYINRPFFNKEFWDNNYSVEKIADQIDNLLI